MKKLQVVLDSIHQSAFFYHGVIAEAGEYRLETYQDGEIDYLGKIYRGKNTPELFIETDICDSDIEMENRIDIHEDKFFTITKNNKIINANMLFLYYNEGMRRFLEYLKKHEKFIVEE